MRKRRKASENHQKGTYVGLWRSIISNCRRWKAVDPTMVVFLCGAPTDGYRELLYQPGNWLARGRFVQCRGCSMERGSLHGIVSYALPYLGFYFVMVLPFFLIRRYLWQKNQKENFA